MFPQIKAVAAQREFAPDCDIVGDSLTCQLSKCLDVWLAHDCERGWRGALTTCKSDRPTSAHQLIGLADSALE